MNTIKQRLKQINLQIQQVETRLNQPKNSVQLLAVSKTKPATDLAIAYQAGQRHFGESYVQEALLKQQALAGFNITWHFIGPIQSNKTKIIAENFNWVHSVDRLKIAKRLSQQRPQHLPDLMIYLQVNISAEPSKSGILLEDLATVIQEIILLPNLCLKGVMAIPQPETNYQQQRQPYQQLYQAVQQLKRPDLKSFSFGMSGDLEAAITEGSTIVRIGSALFGAREAPKNSSPMVE